MSEEVRPFEEYKEMIKDMRKEEMIKGLYDLSARVIKQENIIKEVREHIEKTIEYEKSCGFNRWTYEDGQETYIDMVEKTLEILDKENK